MDDTISRQAAINELGRWLGYLDEDMIERIRIGIKKLPSAQPEQRWIPVSERLPENDESVLISHSQGITKAWWNGRFWSNGMTKKFKTVHAWMPLPEPFR